MSRTWEEILNALETGELRAASKNSSGLWEANTEVKQGILAAFKEGKLVKEGPFIDKHNLMPRNFEVADGVRIVPGGTSIRRGSYVASSVILMPPAYVNVGAYVDEGTMIDSHALVGSCAQIGKNVHLSAAVQIGGVLEPVGQSPVVVEDDCFIGAGAVIVEGIQIGRGAVIAPGVILSKGVSVYDVVNKRVLERGQPIPDNAVVVPGVRPLNANPWAVEQGLSLAAPVIIKYRDDKSNASLVLEEALR